MVMFSSINQASEVPVVSSCWCCYGVVVQDELSSALPLQQLIELLLQSVNLPMDIRVDFRVEHCETTFYGRNLHVKHREVPFHTLRGRVRDRRLWNLRCFLDFLRLDGERDILQPG